MDLKGNWRLLRCGIREEGEKTGKGEVRTRKNVEAC